MSFMALLGYKNFLEIINYTLYGIEAMKKKTPYAVAGIAATIPTQIKELRKKTGLTQAQLAKRSGVGLRFVRDVEQGKPTVRMDKVNQVLALFGCHIEAVTDHEATT